ncbi:MAG: SMP-30/gluconolactonase/LRE family protein [Chitinophagaceae bacterium]|nr:MAG: SMP-30/gluconolactonase/LRE family protein [Chitinophagaceae bacterium]
MKATLELKTQAILGEGPVWDDSIQKLYWIDIRSNQVNRYDPISKQNESWDLDQMVGCIVPKNSEIIVCALQDQLLELNTSTYKTRTLAPLEKHLPDNRANDGKADPGGRLWVGTLHLPGEKGHSNLYRIGEDLEEELQVSGLGMSNGLGWSPENDKMYLVDTMNEIILQFDYSIVDGTITNRKTIIDLKDAEGSPDGMCVDAEGMLWIAFYGGKRVSRYDPSTGKELSAIEVPGVLNVTCCSFGGRDLDTLYITTASQDMSEDDLKKYPESGSLFSVKPGVKGLPLNRFSYNA